MHLVMQPHDFVCFWNAFAAPWGAVRVCGGKGVWEEPVGHQLLKERNQEVDEKKEACQKDSRIRETKEWSSEKIPGSSGCCRRKDFRIKGTK